MLRGMILIPEPGVGVKGCGEKPGAQGDGLEIRASGSSRHWNVRKGSLRFGEEPVNQNLSAMEAASRQIARLSMSMTCGANPRTEAFKLLVESRGWAAGGRLICYFLKRSFKARRGSSGRPDPDDVSRSTVARREKNVQALRARLSAMRSGIGCVHSNRWPGAKWVHCWQACSSARHLGHWPSPSVNEGSSVPQSAQRETVRLGSIPGARAPDDPPSFPPASFSDSRYPR